MNTRLAEEEIFNRKAYPLLYLVKKPHKYGPEKIIQSRSGIFYVMAVIVVFFSIAVLLSIGLKIQAINYEREIISINEMIAMEQERSDRVLLKISELKSPSRIIETAEKNLGMQISNDIMIMQVNGLNTSATEDVDYFTAEKTSDKVQAYDSFIATVYNIRDIVMVVSEGVLTFFIP
jgi:cell division protein FtsL